jgi:hypothetical protein
MRAREGLRSIFLLRARAGLVAPRTRVNILDSVRLALPRSPESGFAVSIHVKKVSRGKRDMWVDFLVRHLFVVVVLRAQLFCFVPPAAKTWRENYLWKA